MSKITNYQQYKSTQRIGRIIDYLKNTVQLPFVVGTDSNGIQTSWYIHIYHLQYIQQIVIFILEHIQH